MAELSPYQRDILIRTALGEARGEGVEGMADVLQVILNRANSGEYPSDPAAVALQPRQFSAWNKGEGGNNPQQFKSTDPIYKKAEQALEAVLSGSRPDYTGGSLDYHSPDVSPYWASSKNQFGTIERNGHIYYPRRPMPPGEIPNVVASRTDTRPQNRSRVQGVTQAPTSTASTVVPTLNATPRLGAEGVYSYNPSDMRSAHIAPGLGSLTPDFFNRSVPLPRPRPAMGADPGGGGLGTLVARVDPASGQAVSVRDVPLPRPRPAMGGDPGGGGIGELVATIPSTQPRAPLPPQRLPPLPPSTLPSPRMVEASMDSVASARDPALAAALERRLSPPPPPVSPMAEYNRLRGNPDMSTGSIASRPAPPVPGPSINYTKDESRLLPNGWGDARVEVADMSAPPIMVGLPGLPSPFPPLPRPRPDRQPMALPQQTRRAPVPAPLYQRPAPVRQALPAQRGQPAPLQITVQGANRYGNGGGVSGSATGRNYNAGQSYQAGGYNYAFNSDGSVTNTDTGITRGGGRRSYDPDTNSWN